jgi:caffeoyl-CoA O-methyltransferase
MINTSLPIVPQDSTDPREVFATTLVRAAELPPRLEAVMTEIETVAKGEGIPVIGRLEGTIVQMLATLCGERAMRVLELGTAIGYSALWLAHALPEGGKVTSIDRAGFADRVAIIVGDVFELLPNLGVYDLIFQDVMKHRYFGDDPALATELLRLTKSHLEVDGILMIDNAFCGGGVVAGDIDEPSNELAGVRRMNDVLAHDPDFAGVIVPVRDGLWVAQRKS